MMHWVPTNLRVPDRFGLRGFDQFTGTRVTVLEGCGRDGHGMSRLVTYWLDENGDLIARHDPASECDTAERPA